MTPMPSRKRKLQNSGQNFASRSRIKYRLPEEPMADGRDIPRDLPHPSTVRMGSDACNVD